MPITINNVTINNQLTIINDAGVNHLSPNDGPRAYSGNTEADVNIDGKAYLNINANDIIPANIHALQFNPATDSGWIEYEGTAQNLDITSSDIPSWANTMITRWNGEKVYEETYSSTFSSLTANLDGSSENFQSDLANAESSAQLAATTAKNNILGA